MPEFEPSLTQGPMLSVLCCPANISPRLSLWNHDRVMEGGSELELSEEFLVSPVSSLSKLGCYFLSPQQRHPGPTGRKAPSFVWPIQWRFYPWEEAILKPICISIITSNTKKQTNTKTLHEGSKEEHWPWGHCPITAGQES